MGAWGVVIWGHGDIPPTRGQVMGTYVSHGDKRSKVSHGNIGTYPPPPKACHGDVGT